MRWTMEKPTYAGFYWYRNRSVDLDPRIVQFSLSKVGDGYVVHPGTNTAVPLAWMSGDWAGPLPQPQEAIL